MKRLLDIEWQKISHNRASKILVLTYFILLSFIALLAAFKVTIFGIEFKIAEQGVFNFPYIWHFNTYMAALFKFFLAVVIVSMMANEYTYGTLKQNLIDGLSKKEFIISKFLMVVVFAAVSTVFVFVMSLVLGYSFSSFNEISIVLTDIGYIGAFFVKLTAFFSLCLFAGMWIKRSAFAIGFIIVWWVIEKICYGLLLWLVFSKTEDADRIVRFLPMESMNNLIKEPFTRFKAYRAIESQLGGAVIPKFYGIHWYEIVIVLAWTAIFVLMSYKILNKRDL